MDIKGIIPKLGFFKNYSFMLLPVVITLVGVLLFMPTQLMSSKLKQQITSESISMGRKVRSLSENVVVRDQWKAEQEYQLAFANDANRTALLSKQSDQRQLLSYKIFPRPKDTSTMTFGQFGRRYREAIDNQIVRLNARECPTKADIEAQSTTSRVGWDTGKSTDKLSEISNTITDALCRARAESASIYFGPTNLAGYEFWRKYEYAGMEKAIEDCWYWQLGYWIIEDIFDTIAVCNEGSSSVFTSPVKRLMEVSFGKAGAVVTEKAGGRPSYVSLPTDGLTSSYTGRVCSSDIDVVHFSFNVVVSTRGVLPFMQQLCSVKQHKFNGFSGEAPEQTYVHNQITILESDVEAVEREDEEHRFYRYGGDAVVKLYLVCEYVFDKGGYDEIKPKWLKEAGGKTGEGEKAKK